MKAILKLVQLLALVAVAVFVVALFANEPGDVDATDTTTTAAPDDGSGTTAPVAAPDGAAIFDSRCASCHGSAGQGSNGPKLADGRVVERFPDLADQIAVVTDGRGGMPSFERKLTPEEIEAVVEYTRTL